MGGFFYGVVYLDGLTFTYIYGLKVIPTILQITSNKIPDELY